jgi:hypothetical protein
VLYLSKYKKSLYLAVPPIGRFINQSGQLALSLLLATAVGFLADHMWRKGGAYSLWSSRYIYININTAIKSK